jgi:hypothetical protein
MSSPLLSASRGLSFRDERKQWRQMQSRQRKKALVTSPWLCLAIFILGLVVCFGRP